MEFIPTIFTVAMVHFLAVVSPGPDFMMIARNSIIYSRKTGIYSAIGLGLGILLHIAYSLVGIGLVIANSIILFNIIKYLGAAYLIYIGYKSIRSKASDLSIVANKERKDLSKWDAIKIGFITNASNPKATLFFLSLFTLVINPNTPMGIKLIMGAEMAFATTAWFVFVAFLISHHVVKSRINRIQHVAEKFIGVVLIALGLKVAFSTSE